ASIQTAVITLSAPNDHLTASPHCRVIESPSGRVDAAGACPSVRAWIVSAADVQKRPALITAPDNHFDAGPHCRVLVAASGRVGRAGSCPIVRGWIVS